MKVEVSYHYEKLDMGCSVGDILLNCNGSSYRVMEKYSDSNMLFQNVDTGMFIVGIGVEFFRKLPKPTGEELARAKELINGYCMDEFGAEADFSKLPIVSIGYTSDVIPELGDGMADIQVNADLENYKIITEIDGVTAEVEQDGTMKEFIEYALEWLDFSALISLSPDAIAVARGDKALSVNPADASIEWGHGIYLSNIPSEIDFAALRREYGKLPEPNEKGEYDIEIREVLSRTESVKAGYLGEALDELMDRYKRGEIVLDAGDFKEVNYIPQHGKGGR